MRAEDMRRGMRVKIAARTTGMGPFRPERIGTIKYLSGRLGSIHCAYVTVDGNKGPSVYDTKYLEPLATPEQGGAQ